MELKKQWGTKNWKMQGENMDEKIHRFIIKMYQGQKIKGCILNYPNKSQSINKILNLWYRAKALEVEEMQLCYCAVYSNTVWRLFY